MRVKDIDNDDNMFPSHIVEIAGNKKFFGRLNDPTCAARVKGICGDEMEFYLVIDNSVINEVKFFTTGCVSSKACGNIAASFIWHKDLYDALKLSPKIILDEFEGLPEDHHHCAMLTCITFYKALGEYFVDRL